MIEYLKICNFTETKAGGTPSTKVKEYWENGDIPWLNSGALNQGIVKTTSKYITKLGLDNSSTKLMPPDTILIALTGATTGITGYLTFEACANQSVVGILPSKRHFPKYLYYYLILIRQKVLKDASGAAQPGVNQKYVKNIQIPIPPIDEQKRIVAKLDECFEAIDKARANVEKNLNNAKELFQSQLNQSFRQPGDGWIENQITNLIEQNRIITYGVIKLGEEESNGIPCLRTSNVRWLYINSGNVKRILPSLSDKYSRTILKGGEVLVNVRGTLGGVAVVTEKMKGWNVSREVAVVPIDKNIINPFYLAYWIGTDFSQKWLGGVKKGAAYVGINIKDLRELPVRAPILDEQVNIVNEIKSIQLKTNILESNYQQELDALDELKKSILQKAFNGEL